MALGNGSESSSAEVVTLGKGATVPNWGFAGIANPAQSTTAATTQSFLVYQFVFNPNGTATANLWVNPSLNGAPTGAPSATTTLPNFSFDRVRVSSASGNFGDIDEVRIGTSFNTVAPVETDVLIAYDGFAYPTGGLTGNGGGDGWGTSLWTTQVNRENANVTSGTLNYSDGALSLVTGGNKVTTTGNSRNWRILGSPVSLDGENPELWISFIGRANSTGNGHLGVALANGSEASSAEIVTLGKGASVPNWGFAGITNSVQSTTAATTQSFLVYQFIFGEAGTATANLWVNPPLNGAPTGAPSASTTLSNFSFDRVRVSSASGNFGDIDELRIGTGFNSVAPAAQSLGGGSMTMSSLQQSEPQELTAEESESSKSASGSKRVASRWEMKAQPTARLSSARFGSLFSLARIELSESELLLQEV